MGGGELLEHLIYQDLNPKKITFRKDKARIKTYYTKIIKINGWGEGGC